MNRIGLSSYATTLVSLVMIWPALVVGQQRYEYHLVLASKASVIEEKMNELAAEGFRFAAGLDRVTGPPVGKAPRVVVMRRVQGSDSAPAVRYRVFRAKRYSMLQEQLTEAGEDGFDLLAMVPNANYNSFLAFFERQVTEP